MHLEPRKGAQGLASQVWGTTARQDRLTHGDVSMALPWWPARDTPGRVERWLRLRCADRRKGGQRLLRIDPVLCWEKRHVNAVDVAGGHRDRRRVPVKEHRAREVWAFGLDGS